MKGCSVNAYPIVTFRKLVNTLNSNKALRILAGNCGGVRALAPEDPVKYDFALTRLGVRRDLHVGDLLNEEGKEEALAYSSDGSMMTL